MSSQTLQEAAIGLRTTASRRRHYRDNVRHVFRATADVYYRYWGQFFHLAVFEEGDDPRDLDAAFTRTHERYFRAISGSTAGRILELACGGGAFSQWMAERTSGDVVGIDISDAQLQRARRRLQHGPANLTFVQHDIMGIAELDVPPFDAAVCLDAACYLPDRRRALRGIAERLRSGARLLLVDWCRSESVTALQQELIFEPFYRAWGIPELETVGGYETAFRAAGFQLLDVDDLSGRVMPNWQTSVRGCQHRARRAPDVHGILGDARVDCGRAPRCAACQGSIPCRASDQGGCRYRIAALRRLSVRTTVSDGLQLKSVSRGRSHS